MRPELSGDVADTGVDTSPASCPAALVPTGPPANEPVPATAGGAEGAAVGVEVVGSEVSEPDMTGAEVAEAEVTEVEVSRAEASGVEASEEDGTAKVAMAEVTSREINGVGDTGADGIDADVDEGVAAKAAPDELPPVAKPSPAVGAPVGASLHTLVSGSSEPDSASTLT